MRRSRVRCAWVLVFAGACTREDLPSFDEGSVSGIASWGGNSGATNTTTAASETESGNSIRLDVGVMDLGLPNVGDCSKGDKGEPGDVEFSYIWIANSPEGTVSKIDTISGTELGRYYTGPTNGGDDPSRTSVNLAGDVAVTNRAGSITKIASQVERCVDQNGDGEIQTSQGPGDILEWGADECVLWHVPLPGGGTDGNRQGPRPTAWDTGIAEDVCMVDDDRVWVGYYDIENNRGHFYRLNGQDGVMIDEVLVPDWNPQPQSYGPYGGAVDGEGDFWISGRAPGGPLIRVDGETLDVTRFELPDSRRAYGIAIDATGKVWTADTTGDIIRFDPASETFDVLSLAGQRLRGLQIDRDGHVWIAANSPCGLVKVDAASMSFIEEHIPLPECGDPVGVSIDVEGFVWVPDRQSDVAYKVHPETFESSVTAGLVAPYTYSDMTGAGLGLVVHPPTG